jgi:periplasmic copper chaperone A
MEFKAGAFAVCLALALALDATVAAAQGVKVENAWVRAALPGQQATGAYLEITSETQAALVAAGSPVAKRAELHTMALEGGIMRMRPVARIELPAGETVKLAPGGFHIMLLGLERALKTGEVVPLVLSVQGSGTALTSVTVEAEVRPLSGAPATHHRH